MLWDILIQKNHARKKKSAGKTLKEKENPTKKPPVLGNVILRSWVMGNGQSLDCCHLMEENASLVPKEKPPEHVYSQLKTSESSLQAICVDCRYLQRKLHANFLQTNCNCIKKALDFYLHLAGNIPSHKPLVLRY